MSVIVLMSYSSLQISNSYRSSIIMIVREKTLCLSMTDLGRGGPVPKCHKFNEVRSGAAARLDRVGEGRIRYEDLQAPEIRSNMRGSFEPFGLPLPQ